MRQSSFHERKMKCTIFIAGIPGSGKSRFGQWLSVEKGFVHVDMESDGLDHFDLREPWDTFRSDSGDHSAFPLALERLDSNICLDWGFPVECMPIIERIKALSSKMVWFEADRLHAREGYLRKPNSSAAAFDCQVAKISLAWQQIERMFRPNFFHTMREDGTLIPPAELYNIVSANQLG